MLEVRLLSLEGDNTLVCHTFKPLFGILFVSTLILPVSIAAQTILNSSFETPDLSGLGRLAYEYNPTGAGWTFLAYSGVARNGSDFEAAPAPDGSQVAFSQGDGAFSQEVSGFQSGVVYSVVFSSAQRRTNSANNLYPQTFDVFLNSDLIGSYQPTGTSFAGYSTVSFAVPASGSYTLKFVGTNQNAINAGATGSALDNTAFVDKVRLNVVPAPGALVTALIGAIPGATLLLRRRRK